MTSALRIAYLSVCLGLIAGLHAADQPASMRVRDYDRFLEELRPKIEAEAKAEFAEAEQRIDLLDNPFQLKEEVEVVRVVGTGAETIKGQYRRMLGSGPFAKVQIGARTILLADLRKLDRERFLLGLDMKTKNIKVQRMREQLAEQIEQWKRFRERQLKENAGYTAAFFERTVRMGDRFWYLEDLGHEQLELHVSVPMGDAAGQLATVRVRNRMKEPSVGLFILERTPLAASYPLLEVKPLPHDQQPEQVQELIRTLRELRAKRAATDRESDADAAPGATPAPAETPATDPAPAPGEDAAEADVAGEDEEDAGEDEDGALRIEDLPRLMTAEPLRRPLRGDDWPMAAFAIMASDLGRRPDTALARYFKVWMYKPGVGSWYLEPLRVRRRRDHRRHVDIYTATLALRRLNSVQEDGDDPRDAYTGLIDQARDYQMAIVNLENERRRGDIAKLHEAKAGELEELASEMRSRDRQMAEEEKIQAIWEKLDWLIGADGERGEMSSSIADIQLKCPEDVDTRNRDWPLVVERQPITNLTDWHDVAEARGRNRKEFYDLQQFRWRYLEADAGEDRKVYYIQWAINILNEGLDKKSVYPLISWHYKEGAVVRDHMFFHLQPGYYGLLLGIKRISKDRLLDQVEKVTVEVLDHDPEKAPKPEPEASPAPPAEGAPGAEEPEETPAAEADGAAAAATEG